MKTSLIIASVILGGGLLMSVVLGAYGIGTYNDAKTLHNQYEAKVKGNEATFDNMWKKNR